MKRLLALALVLCALLTAGCAGSDDERTSETTTPRPTASQAAPDTPPPPQTNATPSRSYAEVMARLPPFDEPASLEVAAWRRATLTASLDRCASRKGGADRASFVAANRAVLAEIAGFPGAAFVRERSIPQRGGNDCPGGRGPATSYTTFRRSRLPAGTKPVAVLAHFAHALSGWLPLRVSSCEWRFVQGPGYVDVRACRRTLLVSAQGRAPVERASPSLPARPAGLQYPNAELNVQLTIEPTAEPGETCERVSGAEVPSIIVPPPPGISAETRGRQVVVEWTLGTVHGDCPPSALVLGYPDGTAHTVHESVHAASGVTRMRLPDGIPRPKQVTARTVSVDGTQSRAVTVLVRRAGEVR